MDNNLNQFIEKYSKIMIERGVIDNELYRKYEVKRGLRDISGKGVLVGLTEISEIISYVIEEGDLVPCEGKLFYRGINIEHLVKGFLDENRFGFEEASFLLLFGHLPNKSEFKEFSDLIKDFSELPENFVRDTIMTAPSKDMMNSLSKSVLTLYAYDDNADNISIENVLLQSIRLIAQFPLLAVYGYQSYSHYFENKSLVIHSPQRNLSIAENILYMLRPDSSYTDLEARILDLALVLHAEHGGGNNSTFTNHVVTSSHTDTYSAVVASLGSLKGPRHGGANVKVVQMFRDMMENLSDWKDDDAINAYLFKLLNKEAFDKSGLIYGMGHAVYSLSDPRASIFRQFVEQLAREKNRQDEYILYSKVENLAPKVIGEKRQIYKGVSANIDFYSGFVYSMLDLPTELFTPIFAVARVVGWSAHRLEELVNNGKIIRPAYKSVTKQQKYIPVSARG
ncbi:MAG: citrate/2-methylcitrate synthase [Treponema sp.]|nr:citrate/2-methylcitrate synthase [Treponema sp.]MCL2251870.1 citrate/2-methylcitrate synthase [Treponema sp.]